MTTSDYLDLQTKLLIAVEQLRRLPLEEFRDLSARITPERPLLDWQGLPVTVNPQSMMAIAESAIEMVSHGPLASNKPVHRDLTPTRGASSGPCLARTG